MDKQKAPWKLRSKQIPLYYLVTLAKSVCFRFLRSYSLSPFKFLLVSAKIITIKMCSSQNQLSILISIISTIFVIARPVYWNKCKLKWYKKWTNKTEEIKGSRDIAPISHKAFFAPPKYLWKTKPFGERLV